MGSEAEALRLRVLAVSEKFMPAEMAGQQAGQPSSRLLYAAADPTDSGWAPPRWQCLGGCFTSSPAAIVDTTGLVHLFARGCDRALWRLSQQARPGSMRSVSRASAQHPSNLPSLEDGQPARERLLYAAGDPAAKKVGYWLPEKHTFSVQHRIESDEVFETREVLVHDKPSIKTHF